MTRRLALALASAVLVLASAAYAQDVPTRRIGVEWRGGVPRVHFSAVDVVDRSLRQRLDDGLAQTLVMRVYAYRANGQPLAVTARTCRVTYDIWQRSYRVEIQDPGRDRTETFGTIDAVLSRCLVARRISVGRRADYAGARDENIYFAVIVEHNPLSPATLNRLRRWLARPAGGGRVGGEAFFGSFVSLFVNRRIGNAERTLRFRSQTVRCE